MSSIYRITIVVFLFLGTSVVAFLGWRDYQIRQNEFYRMGAFYKAKFPKAGKFAVSELETGDPERILILPFLPVPEKCSKSERDFLENTAEDYIRLNRSEMKESAKLFIIGYESTPSTSR